MIVMEALSGEFGVALSWELLCVGGLVVVAETEDGLIGGLNEWRDFVDSGGMEVYMNGARVVVGGGQWGEWCRGLWDGRVVFVVEVLAVV